MRLLLAGIIVLALALPANAATVDLAWDTNTETDLAGYKMHYGTAKGVYNVVVDVGNKTSVNISGLTPGSTYFFVATAYDKSGNESEFSNEVVADIAAPDVTPPDAPGGLRIEVEITISVGE